MIKILNGKKETVAFEANTSLLLFNNIDFEEYPPHWHTPIEIIMPVENGYEMDCNGVYYSLNENDIIIIPPGTLHHLHAVQGRRLILQVDLSRNDIFRAFDTFFSYIQPALAVTPNNFPTIHSQLVALMNNIFNEYNSNDPLKETAIYSSLMQILLLTAREHVNIHGRFSSIKPTKQQEYIDTFVAICQYVTEHCTEDLSLEDISEKAGFSKYHFSRLFKDYANTSFHKYLNTQRIALSETLLLDPNISITEVAVRSGFNSISAFMRMFKIIKGCTPSDFRRMHEH